MISGSWLPRIRPSLLACVAIAAACEQPADTGLPGGVPFLERDSAGVLVATTSGTHARSPIGWVVDTVPEYQIGELEGAEPYLFTGIRGARQLSDGRVLVLDEGSCELRFFGADGVFLERTGGSGEGPGEFRRTVMGCVLVPSPGDDSLRAFDGATLSFFDDRGRFGHRFPVLWRGERVLDVVGVAGKMVLVTTRFFAMSEEEGLPREPSTADFALLDGESWQAVWNRAEVEDPETSPTGLSPSSAPEASPTPREYPSTGFATGACRSPPDRPPRRGP